VPCSPPPSDDYPSWTDESWASPLDVTRRIFCNRSLNMRTITAVGFDMVSRCAEEGMFHQGWVWIPILSLHTEG
jgi:hypothetical protein